MPEDLRARRLMPPTPGSRGPAYTSRAPASSRSSSSRRLFVLLLLLLGLLIWPAPQAEQFIRAHLTPGTIASLLGNQVARLPGGVEDFVPAGGTHQYWQVGLGAGDDSADASGMRADIETRLPQRVSQDTTNYFWIGSYLRDRSFIQAGYYIPADHADQAGWFYCAFTPSRARGPCQYGALGSAGVNGSRHTYTLESVQPGAHWRVLMDGKLLGQFAWTASDSGASLPVIYAESSGYAQHGATSQLGPVAIAGFATRHAGSASYVPAAHLRVMYSAANVCPPYGVQSDGHGGMLLGSGLACPARFSALA
jgi:hypothetical protein